MYLLADQMVLYYGFAHRSIKWWKCVFFHILDTCIVNANILYNATSVKLEFRRAVAEGLLCNYEAAKVRHRAQDPQLPLCLKEQAFPEPIPDNSRPDCQVCSNKAAGRRGQTSYRCKLCNTPLCLYLCFEKYHTLLNYK